MHESGSASKHSHDHGHELPFRPGERNPHANLTPQDRLDRLFMFLEAQFGADAVSPIEVPKLPKAVAASEKTEGVKAEEEMVGVKRGNEVGKGEGDDQLEERQRAELERLHKMGIPVPGVLISIDGGKMKATVWLENLEVECANKVFADRVRAVVERAVEVIAPLWG